jgi:predicted component of type VI protein secretion system
VTLIKDQRVSPFHCRIDDRGGRYSIAAYEGAELRVNGVAVANHWLRGGDTVELGGTSLTYQERQAKTIGGNSGYHRG